MNRLKVNLGWEKMESLFFMLGWKFHFDLGHKDQVTEYLNILYSMG